MLRPFPPLTQGLGRSAHCSFQKSCLSRRSRFLWERDGITRSSVLSKETAPTNPLFSRLKLFREIRQPMSLNDMAVIKLAAADNQIAKKSLKREWETYRRPPVASSMSFRRMYELIGDPRGFEKASESSTATPCLALEWLDHTLEDVKPSLDRHGYLLITAVIETIMSSIVALEQVGLVNTDTKPANILISGAGTDHPVVKVADLGLTFPTNTRPKAQPHAMRAPEVHLGQPCTAHCQIWACTAMLLCWLKPGILGIAGNNGGPLLRNSWCIAKLKRLFPDWNPTLVDDSKDPVVKAEFVAADMFLQEAHPILQDILPLDEEMERMGLLPELRALLRFLLVIDPDARPSTSQILASQELRALKEAALGLA